VPESFTCGAQDFAGEGVVVDRACEDERSDKCADGDDGLTSSVAAAAEHALEDADVSLDQSVVAAADAIVSAVDVADQRGHGAAGAGVVAVLCREIPVDPGGQRIPLVVGVLGEGSVRVRKGIVRGFGD
jgi:hypothetical protein